MIDHTTSYHLQALTNKMLSIFEGKQNGYSLHHYSKHVPNPSLPSTRREKINTYTYPQ
jgi:hypothetical protein